ncbi:MAG: gamma-glutamyltransferase [Lentisphaeraceae bacterium]|nr:gamma-glutamyltransferase [Lentisphaeraceae bacterium]
MFKTLILLLFTFSLYAADPILTLDARNHPQVSQNGMLVCQDEIAAQVGIKVLKDGGNAADAAVAVAYTLAVTLPKAGNIGGGGFALYYDAKKKKTFVLDFREAAPARSMEKMFQDSDGNVLESKSRFSLQASGVPGTVSGLSALLKRFGSVDHKRLIAPAIELAEKGFPVSKPLAYDLKSMSDELQKSAAVKDIFYKNGKAYKQGEILKQKALANTLKKLSENGPQEFYTGEIAKTFVDYFSKHDGLISLKDLKNYKTLIYEPVKGTYRGYEIHAMPPPSSGGVHVIQMLNILEGWDLAKSGHNSAQTLHYMTEAMKLAYADRSKHMGDPNFSKLPVKGLISKEYAKHLREQINVQKARPSSEIQPGTPAAHESPDTTHFSIADKFGNVVSFTYTINFSFGSRIIIPELGFFLNNEMDDFSAKPGVPNGYGLIGGEANKIEAGKRPLSSMTPVIMFKDKKPILVTGSPGGSKIINTVLQIILNVVDHKLNIAEATMAPRIHHQWLPDKLNLEQGFSPDTIKLLKSMGHNTIRQNGMGCTESIIIQNGFFYGFADQRRMDGKVEGY